MEFQLLLDLVQRDAVEHLEEIKSQLSGRVVEKEDPMKKRPG